MQEASAADASMLRSIVDEARIASKLKDLTEEVLPAQAVALPPQIDEAKGMPVLMMELEGKEPAKAALPAQMDPNKSTCSSPPPTANIGTAHSDSLQGLHSCLRECHKLLCWRARHA